MLTVVWNLYFVPYHILSINLEECYMKYVYVQ